MRKDGLLGQIYRHNDKKISSNVYSTNNIAVQVFLSILALNLVSHNLRIIYHIR